MNYCGIYNQITQPLSYIDKLQEWKILYRKQDTSLPAFIELHTDKKIILEIKDEDFDNTFIREGLFVLAEKYKNITLLLGEYSAEKAAMAKSAHIKFFFINRVNNWDTLIGLIAAGVSEVYITDELGFEITDVAEVAHSKGVNIRVYPDVAQSQWIGTTGLMQFFIRPEDVASYEPYVDTLEFYNESIKQEIYYKVYAEDKQWFGALNEIITGLNSEIDSRYLLKNFVNKRLRCGRKCLKGGSCNRCQEIEHLSKNLKESHLRVSFDEKENLLYNNENDEERSELWQEEQD